jgi:xanthine/uracil/vitamin C permease (AzgA family)
MTRVSRHADRETDLVGEAVRHRPHKPQVGRLDFQPLEMLALGQIFGIFGLPALIIVGWLMISVLTEGEEAAEEEQRGGVRAGRKLAGIDFHDLAIGLAAALTIMIMPFTWSITNGIGFGFISYVLIKLARGKPGEVHPLLYVVALLFALAFLVPE